MGKSIQFLPEIDRVQNVHSRSGVRKKLHLRIVFLTAIAAILVLLAGCAQTTDKGQKPLSGEQIEFVNQNTEDYPIRPLPNGFSMELKSVIPVSNTVYVIFGLTAPENMDFSDVLDIRSDASLAFPGLQAMPSASDLPANISYDVMDDGDGKQNTLKIVIRIHPVMRQGTDSVFGPGKTCEIVFKNIVKLGHDREYEQELLTTGYAGQAGCVFTPEEAERVHPEVLLVSGEWKFVIDLAEADSGEIELLETPVSAKVWVIRNGAGDFEAIDAIENVTLTSVRVTPIRVEISFAIPEPSDTFSCLLIDTAGFPSPPGTDAIDHKDVCLVLKDGTDISLFQSEGANDTAILVTDSPVVLGEIAYMQLSDGTKLHAK